MDVNNVVEKVKNSAAQVVEGTERVTKNVVQKTNSLLEQTKLRFAMNEIDQKIKGEYEKIGQYVYETYKDGAQFSDTAGEACEAIDKLFGEYAEIRQRMAELKNVIVCPSCGGQNNPENNFCASCGEKL